MQKWEPERVSGGGGGRVTGSTDPAGAGSGHLSAGWLGGRDKNSDFFLKAGK